MLSTPLMFTLQVRGARGDVPGRGEAGVQRPDRAAARRPAAAPAVRPAQLRGALQPPHSQPAAETLQTSAQAD